MVYVRHFNGNIACLSLQLTVFGCRGLSGQNVQLLVAEERMIDRDNVRDHSMEAFPVMDQPKIEETATPIHAQVDIL